MSDFSLLLILIGTNLGILGLLWSNVIQRKIYRLQQSQIESLYLLLNLQNVQRNHEEGQRGDSGA